MACGGGVDSPLTMVLGVANTVMQKFVSQVMRACLVPTALAAMLAGPAVAFAARGVVEGTVTDATSGLPISGITVMLADFSGGHWAVGATDAEGHYALSPTQYPPSSTAAPSRPTPPRFR